MPSEAEETQVFLMDIALDGEIDGVETARQIKDFFNIPIVYLTAHADKDVEVQKSDQAGINLLWDINILFLCQMDQPV